MNAIRTLEGDFTGSDGRFALVAGRWNAFVVEHLVAGARAAGYTHMYLETVTAMTDAAAVYQKFGFQYLDAPIGDTGHGGCDRYMLREL